MHSFIFRNIHTCSRPIYACMSYHDAIQIPLGTLAKTMKESCMVGGGITASSPTYNRSVRPEHGFVMLYEQTRNVFDTIYHLLDVRCCLIIKNKTHLRVGRTCRIVGVFN
jgi:hypothetical protein